IGQRNRLIDDALGTIDRHRAEGGVVIGPRVHEVGAERVAIVKAPPPNRPEHLRWRTAIRARVGEWPAPSAAGSASIGTNHAAGAAGSADTAAAAPTGPPHSAVGADGQYAAA